MPSDRVPTAYYAKGNYFTLAGRSPFSRLIYPVPVPGGLGVHITVDLGGQAKFGPDVEWIDGIDYTVDPHRADKFYAAVRRYWPGLKDGALQPGYAGIRPKTVPQGAPAQDFVVQGPADHGVPGLINLFGIESPGLTASLALAEQVRDIAASMTLGPARPLRRPRGSARRLLSGHAAQRHRLAPGLHARSRHRLRSRSRARSSISTGPTSRAPTARR